MTKSIQQNLLLELFNYDKTTGIVTRRIRVGNCYKGVTVGTKRKDGYLLVIINATPYQLHRIIWIMETGEQPITIDHINHNRSDNRWCNIRNVSQKVNTYNQSLKSSNKSGHAGVMYDKVRKKWRSFIVVDNKQIYLGRFNKIDEAIKARVKSEKHHGFHINHCH